MAHIGATYLRPAMDRSTRKDTIERLDGEIRHSGIEFDGIAFRGLSGALVAPTLSDRFNVPMICVRKRDGNHGGYSLEGDTRVKRYIIVDDMIASGVTCSTIINEIAASNLFAAQCVGIFLYNHDGEDDIPSVISSEIPVFAARFTKDQWGELCRHKVFLDSITIDLGYAEIAAKKILNENKKLIGKV